MKLKLNKPWPAPRTIMQPGLYSIPGDITKTLAKCAVADGCGEIIAGATFREPPRKDFAPENKLMPAAPEHKGPVEPVRGRSERTKPDTGGRKPRPGAKPDRSK